MSDIWDARLLLWDEPCTCGGSDKFPDVSKCRCLAPHEAGLLCEGCNGGVLLVKGTSQHEGGRGYFLGCSQYKKLACIYTKRYGSPHDAGARQELDEMQKQRQRQAEQGEREWDCITDDYEKDWRNYCQCGGAKELDTYQCYMRGNGGCGFLPNCPTVV